MLAVGKELGQSPEGVFLIQVHQQDGGDLTHPLAVAHLLGGPQEKRQVQLNRGIIHNSIEPQPHRPREESTWMSDVGWRQTVDVCGLQTHCARCYNIINTSTKGCGNIYCSPIYTIAKIMSSIWITASLSQPWLNDLHSRYRPWQAHIHKTRHTWYLSILSLFMAQQEMGSLKDPFKEIQ